MKQSFPLKVISSEQDEVGISRFTDGWLGHEENQKIVRLSKHFGNDDAVVFDHGYYVVNYDDTNWRKLAAIVSDHCEELSLELVSTISASATSISNGIEVRSDT